MAYTLPEHGDYVLMSLKPDIRRLEQGEGEGGKERGRTEGVNRRRNAPEGSKGWSMPFCCYWINNFTCTRGGSASRAAFDDQTVKAELSDDLQGSARRRKSPSKIGTSIPNTTR